MPGIFGETDSDGVFRVSKWFVFALFSLFSRKLTINFTRRSGEPVVEVSALKISKYPLPAFDWSPDFPGLYAAVGFDKMVHIGFATNTK